MDTNVKQHARTSDLSSVQWHSCTPHACAFARLSCPEDAHTRNAASDFWCAGRTAPGARRAPGQGKRRTSHQSARSGKMCAERRTAVYLGQRRTPASRPRQRSGREAWRRPRISDGKNFRISAFSSFKLRSQKCVRLSSWCSSGGASSTRARSRAGSTRSYLRVWRRVVLWLCAPVSLLCTRCQREARFGGGCRLSPSFPAVASVLDVAPAHRPALMLPSQPPFASTR